MTGVELILAALAAAATAGATSAVQDAYVGLKDLLARRLHGREQAVRRLDGRVTDPGVWRARLGEDLQAVGADADEQILTAARAVLAQADPTGARAGVYNVAANHGAVGQFYAPVTFQQGASVPPVSPGTV
ncbi:hypothetical protein [Micromonospora carbonacea]|uniref:Uncharacterized protein n=1 Tax=Micromonospora carbonacea TaxID=47853 RepID=A0A7H8XGH6_9ACTN|nr:hypothetical protein [Micromonospora carbonacea]MBB5829523.1 hypothetical protein [Micromonospora carbonacea]QLD23062.1 hypothetical protein HXZ27_01425 [Micromonospora carbonacea]